MDEYIKKQTLIDIFNAKADMALGTPKEVFFSVVKMIEALPAAQEVIVPPCKVGDTLWIVGEHRGVYSAKVRVFFFNENGVEYIRTTHCDIPSFELGKTAFRTREEAEAVLSERSEE